MLWNIINTILASIGIGLAIWGITYGRRQFELSKRQDDDAKKQSKEDEEWAAKFGRAATSLISIGNKTISLPTYNGMGYHIVFPDVELRHRIEAHLINQDFSNMAIQVRSLTSDQLRPLDVRKTIADVLDAVEKLKRENPKAAKVLNLP
jgi:hypothetical protein